MNRVAIVTGAARGIGAATAARLAREGFAVAACDLDESACAATPEDIAGTVAFLVGDDASFVSGQVIYVAGGPRG